MNHNKHISFTCSDYTEIEAILEERQELKKLGIDMVFYSDGVYICDIEGAVRNDEPFYTARELYIYRRGLEDGANYVEEHPVFKNIFGRD